MLFSFKSPFIKMVPFLIVCMLGAAVLSGTSQTKKDGEKANVSSAGSYDNCRVNISIQKEKNGLNSEPAGLIKVKITSPCDFPVDFHDRMANTFISLWKYSRHPTFDAGTEDHMGLFLFSGVKLTRDEKENKLLKKGVDLEFEIPVENVTWANTVSSSYSNNLLIPHGRYFLSVSVAPFRRGVDLDNDLRERKKLSPVCESNRIEVNL